MKLEDIMWREISQSQKDSTASFHVNSVSKIVKHIEAENRMVVAGAEEGGVVQGVEISSYGRWIHPEICCTAFVNSMVLCTLMQVKRMDFMLSFLNPKTQWNKPTKEHKDIFGGDGYV